MLCCLSNRSPQQPVIARPSGCLFDRRLIEKYISENGRCPITGVPLSLADLIPVHGGIAGHAAGSAISGSNGLATATAVSPSAALRGTPGIPSILDTLQNEWDAIILEQFMLRQQLTQTQQELAHALYQYDSACRLIASLTQERDALRQGMPAGSALNGGAASAAQQHGGADAGKEAIVLPEEVVSAMEATEAATRQARKKRRAPADYATPEQVKNTMESGTVSAVAALSSVTLSSDGKTAIAGTAQGEHAVVVVDTTKGTVTCSGLGHTHAIRHVDATFDSESGSLCGVLTCSDDATVRYWKPSSETEESAASLLQCVGVLKSHAGPVVSASLFSSGRFALSAGEDGLLALSDIERMTTLSTGSAVGSDTRIASLVASAVHPYGSLAAIGTANGEMCIWSTKQMSVDSTVKIPGEHGNIQSIAFNGDCFHIAAGTTRGTAFLWDLRKIEEPVLELADFGAGGRRAGRQSSSGSVVAFDGFGKYLAVASEVVRVFDWAACKAASAAAVTGNDSNEAADALLPLVTLSSHTKSVTGVALNRTAAKMVSVSSDGTLRIYGQN